MCYESPQDSGSGGVPVYLVKALEQGSVLNIATTDSAGAAIAKFLDAADHYSRAWVCGEDGNHLVFDELVRRAQEETDRARMEPPACRDRRS
jgi:hypothetical protein